MKKILLTLLWVLAANGIASEFIEGKHYVTLNGHKNKSSQKVIHFFSFGCSHCFLLKQILKGIENNIKSDQIEKCHVYVNPFGKFLSKAWVLANQLSVAEKVDTLIFKGVENRSIEDELSVKEIFLSVGVEEEVFDTQINSPEIVEIVERQAQEAEKFKIYDIPAVVVGDRFLVKLAEFPWHDRNIFYEKYSNLINELLEKSA